MGIPPEVPNSESEKIVSASFELLKDDRYFKNSVCADFAWSPP